LTWVKRERNTLDKFEYKVRAEEIKTLIERRDYVQAAEIADNVDWRRVKSVMMLCTISDLYKMNRRYEDARDMLLMAYERHPGGRTIVYSLCELSVKMEDYVQAVEYYKEFVQIAPRDTGRYILQYKLYVAQGVSLEEQIEVLEELKKRDYREKWAYELAYLYHRIGLATKCVEECDELILWFGEGKYVIKAMELKLLHHTLTPDQQLTYDNRFGEEAGYEEMPAEEDEPSGGQDEPAGEQASDVSEAEELAEPAEEDIQVKTMDVGLYNTINLQEELAKGLKEVLNIPAAAAEVEPPADTDYQSFVREDTADLVMDQIKQEKLEGDREEAVDPESVAAVQSEPPKALANVLAMESDGQISLVLPDSYKVEKQITGQLRIEDILAEWERIKKNNEEQWLEATRQRVLEHTGAMFTEFDISVKEGLLEKLEGEKVTGLSAEADKDPEAAEPGADEPEIAGEPEELKVSDEVEELDEQQVFDGVKDLEASEAEVVRGSAQTLLDSNESEGAEGADTEFSEAEFEQDKAMVRQLTNDEKALFAAYIQTRSEREQLTASLDNISMASYTGNIIVTGEEGLNTLTLARNMIRQVQMSDSNFSGKIAKISGSALNKKEVSDILKQLKNGALIVQKASGMSGETAENLTKGLQREAFGIIILLEDTKKAMDKFLRENSELEDCFSSRMDLEALSNNMLVAFGRKYAREREYSIDTLGVLALHTRIEDRQTLDHAVTAMDVKDIVDGAIRNANKKTPRHFWDLLLARRYDDEDMIVLGEKDFI